jgi:hypothetical protein
LPIAIDLAIVFGFTGAIESVCLWIALTIGAQPLACAE